MISKDYKEQNRKLHETRPDYGTSGAKWAEHIASIAQFSKSNNLLDYGCGKGTLRKALFGSGLTVQEYDPAIEGKDSPPNPADIVACTDVLEHIEPEHLDAVLDDLKRCTKVCGFFTVATRPAVKTLEDGRNAHLIVEDFRWWLPKLWERFDIIHFQATKGEFVVTVKPCA